MISAAVYPNGTTNPSATGAPYRIYRGWPSGAQLDKDLANGVVNISVFTKIGGARNTTRMAREWVDGPTVDPTMTVSVVGGTVTIGGSAGVTQNVGVRTNEAAWAVTASPTDTPDAIAAALRSLIQGATGVGPTVVMPATDGLVAKVGGTGVAHMEVRRQLQAFQVTIWAPSPALRDSTSSLVDLALAQADWLTLADQSQVWLNYSGSAVVDDPSEARLWRRDLNYMVEYPTNATMTAAQMLFGGGLLVHTSPGVAITVYGNVNPDILPYVNVQ